MNESWKKIDEFLKHRNIAFGFPALSQTTGGQHSPTSYHYQGLARDYGRSSSDIASIVEALTPFASGPDYVLYELFSARENVFFKRGVPFNPSDALYRQHLDHVHVSLKNNIVNL